MIFKGSPNSLKEFYLTVELRLGESYFTGKFTGESGLGEFKSRESKFTVTGWDR